MNKLNFVYALHAGFVVATAYLMSISGVGSWYLALAIALPLILAFLKNFDHFSYGLNVRVLFPISTGLFFVMLYHTFPTFFEDGNSQLALYGISNSSSSVDQAFFAISGTFKDSVSVLYAICAAFLLWKGLVDFDELKHVLYEEVHEVFSISNYLEYFNESGEFTDYNRKIVAEVRANLYVYLANIVGDGKIVVSRDNAPLLSKIARDVANLKTDDANDTISLEEVIKGVTRLSTLRSRRKVCIEKKMSPYILWLMFLMSVAMISTFFGDASGVFSVDYLYVFLMSAFYTALFMTLIDLSSPFEGYWSIKHEAVADTAEALAPFRPSDFEVTHPNHLFLEQKGGSGD